MILQKRKGQIAFEFVVVLAAVLFLSTTVMLDFYTESNMSLMAGFTKNLVETQLGVMSIEDRACIGSYIEEFKITNDTFSFLVRSKLKRCKPKDGEVAYEVEKALCGDKPNGNNIIECGINNFIVEIKWRVVQ